MERIFRDPDGAGMCTSCGLAGLGMSLAGVQRVLALEDELRAAHEHIAQLEEHVQAIMQEMEERVEAAHRVHRRELVPLRSNSIVKMR